MQLAEAASCPPADPEIGRSVCLSSMSGVSVSRVCLLNIWF